MPGTYCPDYQSLRCPAGTTGHSAGVRVVPWTVNEPRLAKAARWGVAASPRTYPDRLREFLAARGFDSCAIAQSQHDDLGLPERARYADKDPAGRSAREVASSGSRAMRCVRCGWVASDGQCPCGTSLPSRAAWSRRDPGAGAAGAGAVHALLGVGEVVGHSDSCTTCDLSGDYWCELGRPAAGLAGAPIRCPRKVACGPLGQWPLVSRHDRRLRARCARRPGRRRCDVAERRTWSCWRVSGGASSR